MVEEAGAIISASPGNIGGFGASHHLRQMMVFLGIPLLPQPEMYLSGVNKVFDEQGQLNNEGTREFLQKFPVAFEDWVGRNRR